MLLLPTGDNRSTLCLFRIQGWKNPNLRHAHWRGSNSPVKQTSCRSRKRCLLASLISGYSIHKLRWRHQHMDAPESREWFGLQTQEKLKKLGSLKQLVRELLPRRRLRRWGRWRRRRRWRRIWRGLWFPETTTSIFIRRRQLILAVSDF